MSNKITEVTDTQNYYAVLMEIIAHAIQNSEHKELRLSLTRNYFKPKESFYFTFSDSFRALVEIPDITKTEIRVFSLLTDIMDFGNEVPPMTQQQLAELLGMKQQNFARSLKKLVKHGVVIKDGKKLIVNPKYCYKGDLHERERTLNALRVAEKRKDNSEPKDSPADD